jgi:fucose permease
LTASQVPGEFADWAALWIGLLTSIMFPGIFTRTLQRCSACPGATSGRLYATILGTAVLVGVADEMAAARNAAH